MVESIVKVPSTASGDMDFLAFSFNGLHSWDDFGIYRVGDGDRYNENLSPTMTDKTAENPGGDGMYFFGTNHKQKDFNINFAFDHLTDSQVREMKKWLNGKEMGDLWFEEAPYKVWTAKVTGQPSIKYIPFDDYDENGNKIRIYKGEGSVVFTAYWPYAHTPDYIITYDKNAEDWTLNNNWRSGKAFDGYKAFYGYEQFQYGTPQNSDTPYGELPFMFIASLGNLNSDGEQTSITNIITTDDGKRQDFQFVTNSSGRTTLLIDNILLKENKRPTWSAVSQDKKNRVDTVIFRNGIKEIPEYAFQHFANLRGIVFPEGLEKLGSMFLSGMNSILTTEYAGSKYLTMRPGKIINDKYEGYLILYDIGNQNLTNFTSHPNTKFISSYACNKSQLIEVHLENTQIVQLGAGAFQDCRSLKKIYLPNTIKYIERGALLNLREDSVIYFSGAKDDWDTINIDKSWGFTPKKLVTIEGEEYDI